MHRMHNWIAKATHHINQLVFLLWTAFLTYRNGPYYTMLELCRNYQLLGYRKLEYNKEFPDSLDGKICLITGGTRGIGLEVARFMFSKGCTIVTGTSSLSTNATTDNILQYKMNLLQQLLNLEKVDSKTIEHYSNRLIVLPLNLTSMSSVAIFAEHVTQVIDRLDFLICNGGVMFVPFSLTRDKQECHMSVNYFGHCLLIFKLIGLLGKGNPNGEKSRIIVVSSGAHHASLGLRIHDLHSTNLYSVYHGYAQSKLALIMFTYRFDRWLQHRTDLRSNMTINCLHPGVCRTGLMERFNFFKLKLIQESPLFRSANEGAETILYTALSSNENGSSGKYFENCSATRSSSVSYDQDLQEKLWIKTCEQLRPWLKIDELSQLCPA